MFIIVKNLQSPSLTATRPPNMCQEKNNNPIPLKIGNNQLPTASCNLTCLSSPSHQVSLIFAQKESNYKGYFSIEWKMPIKISTSRRKCLLWSVKNITQFIQLTSIGNVLSRFSLCTYLYNFLLKNKFLKS
jgi:hypothetical protein